MPQTFNTSLRSLIEQAYAFGRDVSFDHPNASQLERELKQAAERSVKTIGSEYAIKIEYIWRGAKQLGYTHRTNKVNGVLSSDIEHRISALAERLMAVSNKWTVRPQGQVYDFTVKLKAMAWLSSILFTD